MPLAALHPYYILTIRNTYIKQLDKAPTCPAKVNGDYPCNIIIHIVTTESKSELTMSSRKHFSKHGSIICLYIEVR